MRSRNRKMARFVFLTSLTLVIEMLGLPQPFTGPLVNMMLLLTALILGPAYGAGLGVVTPAAAALRGQLPPLLIPMVPFIVVANALFVLVFALVRRLLNSAGRSTVAIESPAAWLGLLFGASVKFGFLFLSARLLVPLLFGRVLPPQMLYAMSLPQWITALAGGAAALFMHRLLSTRLPVVREKITL